MHRPADYTLLKRRWERETDRVARESRRRREALSRLVPVFERYRVTKAFVFGSTCQRRARACSDIDVYIEPLVGDAYWELRRALEEAAGFPIDLHDPSDERTFVRKIKERGELIYGA